MADCTRHVDAALAELEALALGDARLDARARRLLAALARDPAAGFPAAVASVAEREATYRLLNNPRVTLEALLAPHIAHTVTRAAGLGARPLIVVDKTAFVFGGEAPRTGLTRLGPARQGFDAFVALAVSATRCPLGVLGVAPLPGHAGASDAATWAHVVDTVDAPMAALRPIYVMDREADSYALFARLQASARDFVVRVAPTRQVPTAMTPPAPLHTVLAQAPVVATREITLARRSAVGVPRETRRHHPPRAGRTATVTLRAATVVFARTKHTPRTLPATLTLQVVHVREAQPPAGTPPVEWMLVTTLPITTAADVDAIVEIYRARWTIEEYFKALKTGCAYERRQLESREALLNALGLFAPLAWRLLALRTQPADTAVPTSVLDADEIRVLRDLVGPTRVPATATAADLLTALALLGGHFPQNGRPGWRVLWIGLQKVLDRAEGYRLARADLAAAAHPSPSNM